MPVCGRAAHGGVSPCPLCIKIIRLAEAEGPDVPFTGEDAVADINNGQAQCNGKALKQKNAVKETPSAIHAGRAHL